MSNVERNNELLRLTSEYGNRWMHDDVDTHEISNNENGEAIKGKCRSLDWRSMSSRQIPYFHDEIFDLL